VTWWTLYVTATGELRGHTSIDPGGVDPAWSVIQHATRQDQDKIWNPVTKAWEARPPEPPGPVLGTFTLNGVQPVTLTNMATAKTPVVGSEQRIPLHLAQTTRLQTVVRVVGTASSILIAQLSLDGVTYVDGPSVSINTVGLKVSAFVAVPEQYRTDAWVRLASQGGNATLDPQLGLTTLQIA
jgi:hypothetical protein